MTVLLFTEHGEKIIDVRDIRMGDLFKCMDESHEGGWMRAEQNAMLRPHPGDPAKSVWTIRAKKIDESVEAVVVDQMIVDGVIVAQIVIPFLND